MTREKFAFISLVAIIACVLFYQVDSSFSDKFNLNWLFAGLGSVLGVYAIVSLIIGFKK